MRTILFLASSINWYIARENHEAPWSQEVWRYYCERVREMKNMIVGRTTYDLMRSSGEFDTLGDPFTVVLTWRPIPDMPPNHVAVRSCEEALATILSGGFQEAIIAWGSTINTGFLERNLIDEIHLDLEPIVLGAWVPMIWATEYETRLSLLSCQTVGDGIVRLRYAVCRDR